MSNSRGVSAAGHKRATIRDVARAAGVSIGTVSLAMSDNPSVAEATKEKVRQVAATLSYRPSAVGRALQARRTNAIGVVVPHSSHHVFGHLYFMEVLSGVSEVLNQAGLTLVLSTAPTESEEESAYLKILRSQQVDGVILASAALHDKNVAQLKGSPYPFVFIGRYPLDPEVPAVGIDDMGSAREAVWHLLAHGHTRIAHISGPLRHLSAADRYAGYVQALTNAGIKLREAYVREGDYSEQAGWAGMRSLLSLDEPPTALFAANDETAVGAISALRAAGIQPGKEFPVVGFDDVVLARLVTPGLTTIRQPMQMLGVEAAQLLMRLLTEPQAHGVVQTELRTHLVVRESCGCARVEGGEAAVT